MRPTPLFPSNKRKGCFIFLGNFCGESYYLEKLHSKEWNSIGRYNDGSLGSKHGQLWLDQIVDNLAFLSTKDPYRLAIEEAQKYLLLV